MPNDYHPITTQITDLLDAQGCWYETFEHEAVRTSEEAAQTRPGYTLQQGAKAIIVRVKMSKRDRQFVMLVYPADRAFVTRKVKAFFAAKDVRFATEDEVSACTDGVQVGGIPPFGNLFGLPVYAAPALLDNEKIVFNAGDRRFSLAMTSTDYQRLVQPTIIDLL